MPKSSQKLNLDLFYKIAFLISVFGVFAIISDFGFTQTEMSKKSLEKFYFLVMATGLLTTVARYIQKFKPIQRKVFVFDFLSIGFSLWVFYLYLFAGVAFETDSFLENPIWLQLAVILTFIREFSEVKINLERALLNPAQVFILSFLVIIFFGSLLLLLPNATIDKISFIDAIFTSTSAVCVTGLGILDTGKDFTLFGQTIIIVLIQIGGLGILTFASYFSYFFKGGTTYENQLVLSDMTSSRKLNEVFSTLKYIILITFGIELFSAALIYISIDSVNFKSHSEQIFFSAFHAISAFCNAGFSTLSGSFFEEGFRFNYYLQLIIIFTFALGGLGFPIVVNLLTLLRYKISNLLDFSARKSKYRPWVLNLNSRITLITTISITCVAFFAFYFLESNNTLSIHHGFGKIVAALFGATTPRTAGFNTINTADLALPTLVLVTILMWIGASPQSTGGGIKTSTFAIAALNILSLAKGKENIEVFRREIAQISIRRAFAIIALSLGVIGFAIILVSIFDPEKNLVAITFECFSAYSTVGLSLGITSSLTFASKIVIIVVMFVGRISMLSLVIAVFKKTKHKNYKYPKEEITIN